MPKNIRNAPPIIEIGFKYLVIFSMPRDARSIPSAISKNGIASPKENTESKNAPPTTVADEAAKVRIVPKTGPTQGVHPKANVAPNINELRGFPGRIIFEALRVF